MSRCYRLLWRRARLSVFRGNRHDSGTVEGQDRLSLPTSVELTPANLYSAFVPSEKNPLIDILLSRTISGESPSKLVTKSPYRHRSRSISPLKAKRDKRASKPQESPLKSLRSNANADAQASLLSGNAVAGACHPRLALGVLGRTLCRSLD